MFYFTCDRSFSDYWHNQKVPCGADGDVAHTGWEKESYKIEMFENEEKLFSDLIRSLKERCDLSNQQWGQQKTMLKHI